MGSFQASASPYRFPCNKVEPNIFCTRKSGYTRNIQRAERITYC